MMAGYIYFQYEKEHFKNSNTRFLLSSDYLFVPLKLHTHTFYFSKQFDIESNSLLYSETLIHESNSERVK
jgi:hypothetical protein